MADPLSSIASVIAIAGLAAKSSKIIFKFFNGIPSVPADLKHSLLALQSLHETLTALQRSGTKIDPRHNLPPHICTRLNECLTDLKNFEAKLHNSYAILCQKDVSTQGRDGKARKSWEKVKWLLVGEQAMAKFLERIKLYHAELSLYLLTLLATVNDNLAPLGSPTSLQPNGAATQTDMSRFVPPQQPCGCVVQGSPAARALSHVVLPADALTSERPSQRVDTSGSPGESVRDTTFTESVISLLPSQSIRASFLQQWALLSCNFLLHMGPLIEWNSNPTQIVRAKRQNHGFGLGISVYLPKGFRKRFDLALYLVLSSFLSRTKVSLSWEIACPRIIPRNAEIMQCVGAGSTDGMQRLFRMRRESPTDTTADGITLLHVACKTTNRELIKLLIQEGGDVNARDEDGDTPLHWAMARKDRYDIARILLENGADLANVTVDGRTPLHTIFNNTVQSVLSSVEWIEDALPDAQGMSITHYLAWSRKSTPGMYERGVTYDATESWSVDGFRRNCLHLAASRGNSNLLAYLLGRATSAALEARDEQGSSVLHYAMQSNNVDVIDLLLAKGVSINVRDNNGQSVLHRAAQWQNLEAARKLIHLKDSGSLSSCDKNGERPSQLVRGAGATAIRTLLEDFESALEPRTDQTSRRQSDIKFGVDKGLPRARLSTLPKHSQKSRRLSGPARCFVTFLAFTLGFIVIKSSFSGGHNDSRVLYGQMSQPN